MIVKKIVLPALLCFTFLSVNAQKSALFSNEQTKFNHAVDLYENRAFVAAQELFNQLMLDYNPASEWREQCEYYAASSAIRLGQRNADNLMEAFVDDNPTSTLRNKALFETANHYYGTGKYTKAAKWYDRVNATNMPINQEEDFNFKYAYSLFHTKDYAKSKTLFLNLLNSPEYGNQAKYYYGYIAYNQDDYITASKYLGEVVEEASYKKDVSYYMADMNFKLGKFQEAIDHGLPLLKTARRTEHSEISKIVGESYFNLNQYEAAIPHLKNYKGNRGRWNNTDYYLLGYAYYKQNDYENAISTFNKIIDGDNAVSQNAYYHLAECYLKMEDKQAALNAFRNAAHMSYKPDIQEDAWLNYAKLSYEIGNPYKSVPEVLQEYVALYPNSSHTKEINELIISAYITSKDYKGALGYLENKTSAKERTLFQKVAFFRGAELFTEGNYDLAVESFDRSLEIPLDALIRARTFFWKGESQFRMNNFTPALSDFKKFQSSQEAPNTEEYKAINYHIGYAYFKQKEYEMAATAFKRFLQTNPDDEARVNDTHLRIGDGYFISRNYANAISYYRRAVDMGGPASDYAQFQIAISHGLTGNESQKIQTLNSFLNGYSRSTYRDDAFYVLGNSYMKRGENDLAISNYDAIIDNHRRSPLVSKSLLKKGLIYYNTDRNDQAITTYKTVVTRFPNSAEAKQAVKDIRQIYVDLNRVDEYANWVKDVDFVNVTDADLDNDMYEAAERQYLMNNHEKSISGFKKYVQSFPRGLHAVQANFYLAQSLYAQNRFDESVRHYRFVIDEPQTEFSEEALSRLALVYLKSDQWNSAIPVLERLESEANSQHNITFAQSNLMKGYYEQANYSKAVSYAELVLQKSNVENRAKSDAQIIIARSAIQTGNLTKARSAYKEVERVASGELMAEALYYDAYFENQDGSYRVSNEIVQRIAADFAPYKYWAAKGLLIMADNHNELKDAFQATYILESVIKNFQQFSDVVQEAETALRTIKAEQAKTNESIKN